MAYRNDLSVEENLVAAIQKELNREHDSSCDPLSLYQPSPGQLPDHVHHRVARIAARAAMGRLAEGNLTVVSVRPDYSKPALDQPDR